MKLFKSHLWYHKSQRNGILFLLFLIVILQILVVFFPFPLDKKQVVNSAELLAFQEKIDSLKKIEIEKRKPKTYSFNPNYISDFKGAQLGMSLQEIDRLHRFRKKQKWINSAEEFQQVTQISDSLLTVITPLFKFPDWVVKRNQKKEALLFKRHLNQPKNRYNKQVNVKISTHNINRATQQDFLTVKGVSSIVANRIVNYRFKLQGFSFSNQLCEVWGLEKVVANRILQTFKITKKPIISKVNINTASFKEVLKTPYIDYQLCKKIFQYRDEVAEIQNISELKNIQDFPLEKYQRIILYLEAK